jgi:hypothetical protein
MLLGKENVQVAAIRDDTGRADILPRYESMIKWPTAPNEFLFPKNHGETSDIHDPRLEALRWRLDKRIEYVEVSQSIKDKGEVGFVGLYLNQVILLRNDFTYDDESLALCHELLHVCLHPAKGDGSEVSEKAYQREERIVNMATATIASELDIGDYSDFAARFTLPYPSKTVDAQEQGQAEQLASEVLDALQHLEPQSMDSYYVNRKENPVAEATGIDIGSGIALKRRSDAH